MKFEIREIDVPEEIGFIFKKKVKKKYFIPIVKMAGVHKDGEGIGSDLFTWSRNDHVIKYCKFDTKEEVEDIILLYKQLKGIE